jgi:formylglycine-generating enzyme required for sulfatase activity
MSHTALWTLLATLLFGGCALKGVDAPCSTPEIAITAPSGDPTERFTFFMGGDPICEEGDGNPDLECANSPGDLGDRTIPEHDVTLTGFFIDQTEVSNLQYRQCVDDGECEPPIDCKPPLMPANAAAYGCRYDRHEFDDLPVVAVTWDNAQKYCQYRGKRLGLDDKRSWDLPTEAQWERAALGPRQRGETARRYAWGDAPISGERAYVVDDARCGTGTLEDPPQSVRGDTRQDGQSAEGVYDLTGNVREWVRDTFNQSFYCSGGSSDEIRTQRPNECGGGSRKECVRSAQAPLTGSTLAPLSNVGGRMKVVRGGAFCSTNQSQVRHDCDLQTRSRFGMDQDFLTDDVRGFTSDVRAFSKLISGFAPDAQLTGFRCARPILADTQPLDNVCTTNTLVRQVYVPPSGASAASASSSSSSG